MAKFTTRARAIDMLGSQQVANASTAISELFKNAHDAYATRVEADYFKDKELILIRDDGIGMTLEDFKNHWLVIGTEHKIQNEHQTLNYQPPDSKKRPITGEKGIGRLAIALLGEQALVLTRAKRQDGVHKLLMCFIHWGLFKVPRINLDEIDIPIKCVPEGMLPNKDDVQKLLTQVKKSVKKLQNNHGEEKFKKILEDIEKVQVDPEDLNGFLRDRLSKKDLSLQDNNHGTHLLIFPANEGISYEIELELDKKEGKKKDFSKFLLGFTNSVFREQKAPPIATAFRYWETMGEPIDIIREGEFFTKKELESADCKVSGSFDKFGQFKGDIRVLGKEIKGHVISWRKERLQTSCGPFEVEFGYIAGKQRESKIPANEWQRIRDKLQLIGGIYVYRDRIRILPYGNSDVDWLGIEERRTKSAGYYVFSHRRIFGAVRLTSPQNKELREKAGREGFQNDKAYRQLREILRNMLLQLAIDFFRDGKHDDEHQSGTKYKDELEKQGIFLRKHKKSASRKRKSLENDLENFFMSVGKNKPRKEIDELRNSIRKRIADTRQSNLGDISKDLRILESDDRRELSKISDSYIIKKGSFGLTRELQIDWEAYLEKLDNLKNELFDPFEREIVKIYKEARKKIGLDTDQSYLEKLAYEKIHEVERLIKENGLQSKLENVGSSIFSFIENESKTINIITKKLDHRDLEHLSKNKIERLQSQSLKEIDDFKSNVEEKFDKIREMLDTLSSNINRGIDQQDITIGAMDQELLELREQADADAELVQYGLAIAVINHEFAITVRNIRRSLQELRPWADANKKLDNLYQRLRNHFDHLDSHLSLFTPLQRKLDQKMTTIRGSDISNYVKLFFDTRLERHYIKMDITDSFLEAKFNGFPSTIYPVFVNILDNAIFWLKHIKDNRLIMLDTDSNDNAFVLSNNGPAIHMRDYERIFEQGFTRKPGGRGLGLYISKKALQAENMDIEIIPNNEKFGVKVKIKRPKNDRSQ